jgi:hypothetical protein
MKALDMKNIDLVARYLEKAWKHHASGRESFVPIKKSYGLGRGVPCPYPKKLWAREGGTLSLSKKVMG